MFHLSNTDGLGPAFPPVVVVSVNPHMEEGLPDHVAVWLKPISAFGLLTLTMFISGSHMLAMPSNLAPLPRCARSGSLLPHGFGFPFRVGYIVIRASHIRIAPNARLIRLLLTEQQVPFTWLARLGTIT